MALGDIHAATFERLCQRLLREAGFTRVEVTGKTGGGGMAPACLAVNLLPFQVIFQRKRWKGSLGPRRFGISGEEKSGGPTRG